MRKWILCCGFRVAGQGHADFCRNIRVINPFKIYYWKIKFSQNQIAKIHDISQKDEFGQYKIKQVNWIGERSAEANFELLE